MRPMARRPFLCLQRKGISVTPKLTAVVLALSFANMALAQDDRAAERHEMVKQIIELSAQVAAETGQSTLDEHVLEAMETVRRHEFVPKFQRHAAYKNRPLPIGAGQTISQPFIVALMTDLLNLQPEHKVLEIGTGCGYQAAVLAKLAKDVYTIEIVESLGKNAAKTLSRLGYTNVHTKIGDGYGGWPEHAPYDAIIVTAAPDHVPSALIEQLKPGGRLVIPVGTLWQELMVVTKKADGRTTSEDIVPVRFVPLVREK